MGLFSSIVHAISSPVEHLIGKTATNVLFPALPISGYVARLGDTLSNKILSGGAAPPHVSQVPIQQRFGPQPNIIYGGGGVVPQPFYGGGGGGFEPSYPPTDVFQGGSPWGYSTQYSQPLTMPYPTYSAPAQDRSWEDLIVAAAPLFL